MASLTSSVALMEAQSTYTWSPVGPIYTAGRARNMVVDKNDATGNTLYLGSTTSGVFKSVNGGSTWAPIDDQGSVRNISYMAQDQAGNIWVATGEGFLRWGQKAKAQAGTGLYKLQGTTLTKVADASIVGAVINRIACAPNDANRIALATDKGIMISTNGGQSFAPIAGLVANSNSVQSVGMDVKFDNSGVLYCSAGSELAYSVYNAIDTKVYKSDAGLTLLSNITPTASILPDFKYGRIELAIAPSNNNVIYASCASKATANPTTNIIGSAASAVLKAIFVSYDAGSSWVLLKQGASAIDPLSNGGTIASGDYAHVLVVNPSNPDQLFIGGYAFYIFTRTNGSNTNPIGTWSQIGSSSALNSPLYLHENIHDIKVISGSPTKFYFVTDAGVYRSTDMISVNQIVSPSFQPFYKGLVTGQFNSVSIERYPVGVNTGTNGVKGQSVTPYSGFIGGTGGNGLTYYSGTSLLVTQETNYIGGEVYNAEFSRILDGVAITSVGNGGIFRSTNVKSSQPTVVKMNKYGGATISKVAPTSPIPDFSNIGFSTGTPFKLWENYGQIANSPDYAIFYNDSLQVACEPMVGIPALTSQTAFSFSVRRPNKAALIDSIVIRTGTIVLPTTQFANSPAFTGTDLKDITIKLNNNYVVSSTSSLTTPPIVNVTGPVNTSSAPGVTLNSVSQSDEIRVSFASAPFASKTTPYYPTNAASASVAVVQDAASYYRVFATVFYKYKAGDEVTVIDDNISTKSFTYTTKLSQPMRWTRTYANVNTNPSGPKNGVNPPSVVNPATNPVERIPTRASARLAMIMNNDDITKNSKNPNSPYAVVVS
ncbi:MAG: hypothetical protein IT236_08565, partial [Bacteroidia bacterium]|nr:hypothetical protein [Bacteroidia bacterium]